MDDASGRDRDESDALVPAPPAPSGQGSAVALIRRLARLDPRSELLSAITSGSMAASVEAAAGYARDALSPATQATYLRDWESFALWCDGRAMSVDDLPVNPVIVAAYLASLAPTLGNSALRGRVAAIAYHHRRHGLAFLSSHPVIRKTLSGIGRTHGKPVRPAAALTSVEIKQLIATCATDLRGLRDRALFLVGFAGAFRRSELVGIDDEPLRFEAECVVIHLPRSKADQAGQGVDVTVPRMRDAANGAVSDTCPVRRSRSGSGVQRSNTDPSSGRSACIITSRTA